MLLYDNAEQSLSSHFHYHNSQAIINPSREHGQMNTHPLTFSKCKSISTQTISLDVYAYFIHDMPINLHKKAHLGFFSPTWWDENDAKYVLLYYKV